MHKLIIAFGVELWLAGEVVGERTGKEGDKLKLLRTSGACVCVSLSPYWWYG